jgi:murein DD-endopeptidase MepM/ murein hydrolase activator NlpD
MERYSLIVVGDETAPVRRFDVRRRVVRQAAWGVVVAALLFLIGFVDYVRVRVDHVELKALRARTAEQAEKIAAFETTLSSVNGRLGQLKEFERKVRIIANLPGSVATGGTDIAEVGSESGGDLEDDPPAQEQLAPPGEPQGQGASAPAAEAATPSADASVSEKDRVSYLRGEAERLGEIARARSDSLADLLEALEAKRHQLASSPAIWPTQGWLTSRFGHRISPFTGRRQFHPGIDIAGARGTDVIAPARGRVTFSGRRGPLGKSLIIDHGYGVRTLYGHVDDIYVKRGLEVERGQRIASLGNSGRSTGPHLHYVVEVNGKARNPLDYIFD